jgi:hypothetical protein
VFWNAATFVARIASAIISIPGAVLDATSAAATYLLHVAVEGVKLGAEIQARLATSLVNFSESIVHALEVFLKYLRTLISDALSPIILPMVSAARSFDGSMGSALNRTLSDELTNGSVTPADALAVAHLLDPLAEIGTALSIAIGIAVGLVTAFSLGAGFLLSVFLSIIPAVAQGFIQGVATVTSLTSAAVLNLGRSFPNSVPKTTWEAVAATIAICASSSDFALALATAAMKGLTDEIAGTLVFSIMVDLVVLMFSWILWARDLPVLAVFALALACAAVYASLRAFTASISAIKTYATVSVILAGTGLGAAFADFLLAET